jgi:hypothetical protein
MRNFFGFQRAKCNLIPQRLKNEVVARINQRNIDRRVAQCARSRHATEPAAHDYYLRLFHSLLP